MFALTYAGTFWNRVCHDARVATKKGYPDTINRVKLAPGMLFSDVGAIDREEDCTHFLSCCVGQVEAKVKINGREFRFRGGGLKIPCPFKKEGVYGETYAPRGVGALIANRAKFVPPQFHVTNYDATRQAIRTQLQPGDVLAYASKEDLDHYEHMVILVGPDKIACHTRMRFFADYNDISFPWVTLLKLPS
jgi:hypothetical protein